MLQEVAQLKRLAGKAKTPQEKSALKQKLSLVIDKMQSQVADIKDSNAFWYYEPSDGTLTEKGSALLNKYLKPDDIPRRFDSQVDVHKCQDAFIDVSGGNQSGKSAGDAVEDFIFATGEIPYSMKDWYPKEKLSDKPFKRMRVVGVNDDQLFNTVLPTYKKWCPKEYLKGGDWDKSWSAQHKLLTLFKGQKEVASFEFKTNKQDPETFQGPPLDSVTYDEEPLQSIHKENMLRFVTAEKVRVRFGRTPTKGITWLSDFFNDDKDSRGRKSRFQLCTVTNRHANIESVEAIVSELSDYNEILMRLLGEIVSLSGLVYGKLFDKSIHVIPPFPLRNPDHFIIRGIDPHLVKASACVELAVDREGNEYVVGCYQEKNDTEEFKMALNQRAIDKNYRLGWSICDKSADSDIEVFGGRNIYKEIGRGKYALPGLVKSQKYTGSIKAGVDLIKKLLKVDDVRKKPRLFFFDTPEVRPLIRSMQTMERDVWINEDVKGEKDEIREGKHDLHACLRYIHQRVVNWMPPEEAIPEIEEEVYI